MACSLVFGAPCQLRLLAGQEHGRTIPLANLARSAYPYGYRTHQSLAENETNSRARPPMCFALMSVRLGLNRCSTSVRQPCSSRALALHAISGLRRWSFRVAARHDLDPALAEPLTSSSSS